MEEGREAEVPEALARKATEAAWEKQASDIVLLDVRKACSYADYLILCNGESERQIQAIVEAMDQAVKEDGGNLLRMEGGPDSGWVLMDFGDIIVHIFRPQERAYYALEELWGQANPLLRMQ